MAYIPQKLCQCKKYVKFLALPSRVWYHISTRSIYYHPAAAEKGFPYEGKLSPQVTDEVDLPPRLPPLIRLLRIRSAATFPRGGRLIVTEKPPSLREVSSECETEGVPFPSDAGCGERARPLSHGCAVPALPKGELSAVTINFSFILKSSPTKKAPPHNTVHGSAFGINDSVIHRGQPLRTGRR